MDSPTRKSSWKDRLTYVSRKFGVGATSPVVKQASPSDGEIGVKEREREVDTKGEARTEREPDEDWCVLTVNGSNLSAVYTAVGHRVEEVDGTVFTNCEEGVMEREQPDGFFDRFRSSKKSEKGTSSSSLTSSPSGIGSRKSSFGSRLKPEGSKITRPGSPQPLQRRSSGKPKDGHDNHHANGHSSPRSGSPNRAERSSGSSRRKASSSNPPSRNESPNLAEPRRHELHTGLHVKQTHQNGKGGRSSPASNSASSGAGGESAFSKVRDTLKISKAKKKLKKKKGTAYSVDPVEINFPATTKYHDPFEAQPNFTDSLDAGSKAQSHDFKPVSIPHNKPEYCDHCSETAWGIYRQVLKCSICDFIVHRKCESKVVIDCSSRLERAVLQRDQLVEENATAEEEEDTEKEKDKKLLEATPRVPAPTDQQVEAMSTLSPTPTTHHHSPSPQVLSEKAKFAKKIRDYNRRTTPVNHIHIKGAHAQREGVIEYQGFVRVHMCVQRPIHVSTAITRTSWYRLMRPVKERSEDAGLETAFYLPTDTNRLVHITNSTTTKELIQILLKKFCVTDNPKKFSLYEEYGGDCRRLFEEDNPLEIALEASITNRNSKLVLRDNTYSTIQWDAFTPPELNNFIAILRREEELHMDKLEVRFKVWKECISQAMKEKCKEEISMQTYLGSDARNGTSVTLDSRTQA